MRDNQLIMTAFRRDGVSKFAQNNKYGFFPFSFAWQVDQSGWLDDTPLDELKIRWDGGRLETTGIGSYGTLSNYGVSSNIWKCIRNLMCR